MLFFRGGHPVSERVRNAYVSGELTAAERSRVDTHLEMCAACRDAIVELRAVRSTLQALPQPTAPRSFALRRADVEPQRRAAGGWAPLGLPLAGAVATIALLAFFSLVSVDLAGRAGTTASRSSSSAYEGPAADKSADQGAAAQGGAPLPAGTTAALQAMTAPTASTSLSFEATTPAEPAAPGIQATSPAISSTNRDAAAPGATSTPALGATNGELKSGEDDRTGLRIAEAAAAALAVVAGGAFAFVWRRRKP